MGLDDVVVLLRSSAIPCNIKVQLLQTTSIILQNLKDEALIHKMLARGHINKIIDANLDFKNEEILSWYISFLKSLALRIDAGTVRIFFDVEEKTFPLFTQGLRFFNHSDQMVRSSVRYILLSLVCIDDVMVQDFLVEFFSLYHARDIESSIRN